MLKYRCMMLDFESVIGRQCSPIFLVQQRRLIDASEYFKSASCSFWNHTVSYSYKSMHKLIFSRLCLYLKHFIISRRHQLRSLGVSSAWWIVWGNRQQRPGSNDACDEGGREGWRHWTVCRWGLPMQPGTIIAGDFYQLMWLVGTSGNRVQ